MIKINFGIMKMNQKYMNMYAHIYTYYIYIYVILFGINKHYNHFMTLTLPV